MTRLRGALAAAVTPLSDGGTRLDEESVGSLARFLAGGDLDGTLVGGTTGESLLLTVEERMELVERFLGERPDGFLIAVHAGAQGTADTVALAEHARTAGADAVAVIAPPFFPLEDEELLRHFAAAAEACAPLPFYAYEFAARSGYAIPLGIIDRLRADAPNFAGLKVSDRPFDAVKPYLIDGLDVFIGAEPVVLEGLEAGAAGAVSGLATAFPGVVARLVHDRDPAAHERVIELRAGLAGIPSHAAFKQLLVDHGVLRTADVRRPLRELTSAEAARVRALEAAH